MLYSILLLVVKVINCYIVKYHLQGIGQKQLAELSAAMEIPCMTSTTFFKEHENLSSSIHSSAWEEIKKAGEEERKLAIEAGDVGDDGIPFCTVVADGQWSKRSYKSKYDALSGVVYYILYFRYIFKAH